MILVLSISIDDDDDTDTVVISIDDRQDDNATVGMIFYLVLSSETLSLTRVSMYSLLLLLRTRRQRLHQLLHGTAGDEGSHDTFSVLQFHPDNLNGNKSCRWCRQNTTYNIQRYAAKTLPAFSRRSPSCSRPARESTPPWSRPTARSRTTRCRSSA